MIGTLTGKITQLNPPELILEVNGIGYEINCPLPTFYKISGSETITLHTHFQVKEDLQALYGFLTESEKKTFQRTDQGQWHWSKGCFGDSFTPGAW